MPNTSHNEAEEALLNVKLQAEKLGNLLYDSNMPEDVKDAWAALVPEMEPELAGKFLEMLEAKFSDQETGAIDEELRVKMAVMRERYEQLDRSLDERMEKKLDKFEEITDDLN
jgi:hypothetical protein